MKKPQPQLVILGSANVDHILTVKDFPLAGQTIQAQNYQIAFGGKGANQAVAAARSGAKTGFLACVGQDSFGDQIKAQLAQDGIEHIDTIRSIKDQATGIAMILVNHDAENTISIFSGANACLDIHYVETYKHFIESASLLLVQLEIPLNSVFKAIQIAKDAGVTIILNPAPAQALPDEFLKLVDIITPNQTEAEILTGLSIHSMEDVQAATNILHNKGISTIIMTLGAQGVWLSECGQGQLVPALPVKAIDTIAAGDTFNGAFSTALLEGKTKLEAAKFANTAAAIAVTRHGAQPSIPYREEIDALLERSIPLNQNNI